jgi:predicted ArsR family transcriptional regulator
VARSASFTLTLVGETSGDGAPSAIHKALADGRRTRIVEELRVAREGLDAAELARRVGLHPNTIRFHLGVLSDAGLVASRPAERSAPGRPRILYSLSPDAAAADHDEYRLLATVLAGAVARHDDGSADAEHAGRAWGRYLVRRPLPLEGITDEQAIDDVVDLLDQQGFAPEADRGEIRMRRCPFHQLAETRPEIVCAVHRGLISGALDELGSELEVDALDVFVQPDLCIARLCTPRTRRAARTTDARSTRHPAA